MLFQLTNDHILSGTISLNKLRITGFFLSEMQIIFTIRKSENKSLQKLRDWFLAIAIGIPNLAIEDT
jgi:hypothetical protein